MVPKSIAPLLERLPLKWPACLLYDTSLKFENDIFLGSRTLHTDPLVRGKSCLSVSVSVEDEMTRDISPRIGR